MSVNQVLAEIRKALGDSASPEAISKAFTQATGLVFYNLEPAAKKLYPVLTPFRNKIPRPASAGGTAVNWRAITGINTSRMSGGVSEGNRGGVISTTVASFTSSYKGLGFEDSVTFEADYAARNFDDAKARAVEGLLRALMLYEEQTIIGGNASVALGTPTTPTVGNAGTGGSIAAGTYNVAVVALSLSAWLNSKIDATGVAPTIARTNADGTSDTIAGGTSIKSATASTTTTGSTSVITASTPPVKGAVAYAWFVGTAGAEKLVAITTINSVLITALPGATQALSTAGLASDNSTNALDFDGLIPQCFGLTAGAMTSYLAIGSTATIYTGTTGAIVGQMATGTPGTGTVLSADNKGGVVEIDAMLRAFWDLYRLSPSRMWVNAQEAKNITDKVLTATSGLSALKLIPAAQDGLKGGAMLASYLNRFTMAGAVEIEIKLHPTIPPGTILFETDELPYPLSNVSNVLEMDVRQEYYQLEWPRRTRKYEYGVYVDETLKNYFPSAFGLLTNIANG